MDSIQELFNNLESNDRKIAEETKKTFREFFNQTKESWLLNGMFDYYLNSGSERLIDVIISVREPHDRYLFDRLSDTLRGANRVQGLTLLCHVVRRHPSWIYKITSHSLFKELLRILKLEKDVVVLLSALLIVVMLLPIIASLISPHLQDLFEIFSHLATWKTNNPYKVPEGYLLHIEMGMYSLFDRLYGMFPCNFLSYLRNHYSNKENLTVFTHTIKPMLDTVRMHPLLVTASKELELSSNRWKKIEANDVVLECAKYRIEGRKCDNLREDSSMSSSNQIKMSVSGIMPENPQIGYVELGNHGVPVVASFSANLPETGEFWSPAMILGAVTPPPGTSSSHTPIIQGCVVSAYSPQGGNSPPEAAIEATPESTPIKDMHDPSERARSAAGSSVVRSLNTFHSQPSSPLRKEHPSLKLSSTYIGLQRVNRVISERSQIESAQAKSTVIYSSGSPLRVIPQVERGSPHIPGDRSDEDREVETTMTTSPSCPRQVKREDSVLGESSECGISDGVEWREWKEGGSANYFARRLRYYSHCQPDSLKPLSLGFSGGSNSPTETRKIFIRRTASCPHIPLPLGSNSKTISNKSVKINQKEKGTQTDPLPYEQLLSPVMVPSQQMQRHSAPPDIASLPSSHNDRLRDPCDDKYLEELRRILKSERSMADNNEPYTEVRQLKDHAVMLTFMVQFEKYRREVHAERNRRLLGRNRDNRALEGHNSALRDQVKILQNEIDMLHKDISRVRQESKEQEKKQKRSETFWEEQNLSIHNQWKEATELIQKLNEDFKEEKRKREAIAKGYAKLEAEAFELRNTKKEAELAIQRAQEMKIEMANLQHHLTAASELEIRLRSWIDDLLLTSNKGAEAEMKLNACQHTISELNRKVDVSTLKMEAAINKLKQAEELYTKREKIIEERTKEIEEIRKDCDQQIKGREEDCEKLREVNVERDFELLRLQAQVGLLEDKVKRLSINQPATAELRPPPPAISDLVNRNSGLLSVPTDETVPIPDLHFIVRGDEKKEADSDITLSP